MDDELIDVLIVLSILLLGVIGVVILLAMNIKSFRTWIHCAKDTNDSESLKVHPKRTTIKVVRKANTIVAKKEKNEATKVPVSKVHSSPIQKSEQHPNTELTKELIFIVVRSPSYKADMAYNEASASAYTGSTVDSYPTNQMSSFQKRRCSM
ncbi:hypothetical protein DICVIV_00414 [Dictyocaulus viviparus]|uniref:Uncharacterized protein n=1 Tax=Dictyocaulus viviparus TaxID=29172 RepID=A0A0D8YF75_DICVI|nr:hypothetical protein DICVIV_00414 [Dictyocaulus viviparus]